MLSFTSLPLFSSGKIVFVNRHLQILMTRKKVLKDDLSAVIIVWLKAMEFDVYEKYAEDIFHENGRTTLNALLQNSDAIITLEVSPNEYLKLFWLVKVNHSFNGGYNIHLLLLFKKNLSHKTHNEIQIRGMVIQSPGGEQDVFQTSRCLKHNGK